uniref:Uncharacterized protein n=1 Tax=Anopheles farauti TaxID=69004 RepID=A0A182Q3W3_9DIPT
MHVLMRSATHHRALGARSGSGGRVMQRTHRYIARSDAGADGIIRPGHRCRGRRIAIGGLRHLAAGRQIAVRARHVAEPGRIHPTLEAARVEASCRLVEIPFARGLYTVHALKCLSVLPLPDVCSVRQYPAVW